MDWAWVSLLWTRQPILARSCILCAQPHFSPVLTAVQRTFNPKTLYCYSKTTHVIPYESKYMLRPSDTNGELGISFCLKCYKEQKRGSTVFVDDTGSGER